MKRLPSFGGLGVTVGLAAAMLAAWSSGLVAAQPKIEPELTPDRELLARIEALPDNTWLKLPPIKTAGDLSWCGQPDWPNTENFPKFGPGGRGYSNKLVWAPDRQRALYCGAHHQTPHFLNDVWEYDLAANTWVCLGVPDPQYPWPYLRKPTAEQEERMVQWVRKNVVFKDGVVQTSRGGLVRACHTWWGLCYDADRRRMLWLDPHKGLVFTDVATLARGLDLTVAELKAQQKPADYLWVFDPVRRTWEAIETGFPAAGEACILEYLPDLHTLFLKSGTRSTGTGTYLFQRDTQSWKPLAKGAPGYGTVGAYDPDTKTMVVVDAGKTYAYSFADDRWKCVQENPPAGGRDCTCLFHYDRVARRCVLYTHVVKPNLWLYDVIGNQWTDPRPHGDVPPESTGDLAGYYDPQRNVTVRYNGREVWVYRCQRASK